MTGTRPARSTERGRCVAGTLITSAIALVIGVPVAIATALYVSEFAPRRVRGPLTILVELLAAVPSVVYGLWGVFVLVPRLKPAEQWFSDTFSFLPFVGGTVAGPNYFVAGLILAIMILPIVSALSREVIATVPQDLKEASLALGATRWEMIRQAVLPYSRAGITSASMLGLGRAIGETIAVTLVIGNAPTIGDSIFSQGYTLAAVIANEFGEAANDPVHSGALIAAGLALFVITLIVNAIARSIVRRAERKRTAPVEHQRRRRRRAARGSRRGTGDERMSVLVGVSPRRRATDRAMRALLVLGTLAALVPLGLIIYYLIERGLGAWSLDFFTEDPTGNFLGDQGGVRSAILGTLEIVALASIVAIPFGWGVALYLVEFGRAGRFANSVRYFVDVMTGVPSIVFGLFIYVTLVVGEVGGSGFAAWKGSAALALLMLPVVTRAAEVVLQLVPNSLREAALALGAPRWRMTMHVVLPTALPGLITGSLLAIARAAGETAPLLFTVAIVNGASANLNGRINSLPVQIFTDVSSPNDQLVERAWGAALLLVVLILLTTVGARLIQRRSRIS